MTELLNKRELTFYNSTQAINPSNTPRVIAPASTISWHHTTSDPPPRTPSPDCGPGGPVP